GARTGELAARRTLAPVALVAASAMLYVSFKIAVVLLRRYSDDADAAVARTWARALLAALAGLTARLVGVPPGRHAVFWIYTGLAGAIYQAARTHDAQLALGFDRHDLYRLAAIDGALAALLWCL